MPLTRVPVKIYGVVVGSAHVHDDGTFDLNIDGPNEQGKDVLKRLQNGEYAALNIVPEDVDGWAISTSKPLEVVVDGDDVIVAVSPHDS